MKGKHNESLSLRLFNNGKDVKMEKENKGVSHTSFEVQRKKKSNMAANVRVFLLYFVKIFNIHTF